MPSYFDFDNEYIFRLIQKEGFLDEHVILGVKIVCTLFVEWLDLIRFEMSELIALKYLVKDYN